MTQELYGVYRATVVDIDDPLQKRRIRVSPPSTLGDALAVWAPVLLSESLASAQVGDIVLVAFENGSASYPIVLGLIERAG